MPRSDTPALSRRAAVSGMAALSTLALAGAATATTGANPDAEMIGLCGRIVAAHYEAEELFRIAGRLEADVDVLRPEAPVELTLPIPVMIVGEKPLTPKGQVWTVAEIDKVLADPVFCRCQTSSTPDGKRTITYWDEPYPDAVTAKLRELRELAAAHETATEQAETENAEHTCAKDAERRAVAASSAMWKDVGRMAAMPATTLAGICAKIEVFRLVELNFLDADNWELDSEAMSSASVARDIFAMTDQKGRANG